jgi:DNA-directed RNA polymerase subunit M/transcription elongation factor TFIIS
MPKPKAPPEKPPPEPFVQKIKKELSRVVGPRIVYPSQRMECIRDLGNDWDIENEIYCFCNGEINWYIPAIQFAIAHEGDRRNLLQRYVNQCNRVADPDPAEIEGEPADEVARRIRETRFEPVSIDPTIGLTNKRCPVCKGRDLLPMPRQTCSADEGQTLFFSCNNPKCNNDQLFK